MPFLPISDADQNLLLRTRAEVESCIQAGNADSDAKVYLDALNDLISHGDRPSWLKLTGLQIHLRRKWSVTRRG